MTYYDQMLKLIMELEDAYRRLLDDDAAAVNNKEIVDVVKQHSVTQLENINALAVAKVLDEEK